MTVDRAELDQRLRALGSLTGPDAPFLVLADWLECEGDPTAPSSA